MNNFNSTITITFGDQGENHVGMEKIGKMADEGISLKDLLKFKAFFDKHSKSDLGKTELLHLNKLLPSGIPKQEDAYVLIVRGGLDLLLSLKSKYTSDDVFNELNSLETDKQALMRGKVVNKKARYNLCFADYSREANISEGMGTIINFNEMPLTQFVRKSIGAIGGEKFQDLIGEGNFYYDAEKCYIGFHGDSERRIVIAFRVGSSFPLYYQWYYKSKPVGQILKLTINHGDIYFMSQKATGTDWKKRNTYTLRHAAGFNQIIFKKKKK